MKSCDHIDLLFGRAFLIDTSCLAIRLHNMHAVHRCRLLRRMSHVTWCVCLCVEHTDVGAKMFELIEILFGWLTHMVGPSEYCFICGRIHLPP